MLSKEDRNRIAVNIWTARVIPVLLAGIAGYATYVVVVVLCTHYLIAKHHEHGAAIAIIVVYFILFIFMTTSFLRLAYVTTFDPPYVPLGPNANRSNLDKFDGRSGSEEDGLGGAEYELGDTSAHTVRGVPGSKDDPDCPGLELFYTKDVFVCEMDGRPRWCSQCQNWKPDRAHHCSSSGRCIRKMDHFCPWVGGPVGENNFKFFIQFTGYTALYCLNILIIMTVYVRQQVSSKVETLNAQFAVILGISAFFFLFTAGMTGTSAHLTIANLTQVESLNAKTKIHVLAVHKPAHLDPKAVLQPTIPEITYPLTLGVQTLAAPQAVVASDIPPRPNAQSQALPSTQDVPARPATTSSAGETFFNGNSAERIINSSSRTAEALNAELDIISPPKNSHWKRDQMATRTFVVLRTPTQGQNPWRLNTALLNWQTVMGNNFLDWILPLHRSPCTNHDSPESQFAIGPCVDQLKLDNGLITAEELRLNRDRQASAPRYAKNG